ncbi:MAG: amino acid adenylation domain-containing protein [Kordia sp.]|uniref:non-ribosomal peptide synthetase n=1 Tax=Kordia sp. TaxID=1965332 RepID=UPI00385CDB2E
MNSLKTKTLKKTLLHTLNFHNVKLNVVNGQLKVNAPKGALTTDLLEQIKSNKDYLINLLTSNKNIPKAVEQESYPVTPAQKRLWIMSNFDGGNQAYNITNELELTGNFNTELFSKAFQSLVAKYESLRTYFKQTEAGELRQYIASVKAMNTTVEVHDVSEQPTGKAELITAHYQHTFDLSKAPLFKLQVVKTGAENFLVLFNLHHIIGDGWSLELISKELVAMYNQLVEGKTIETENTAIQYKDYAVWLQEDKQQEKLVASKDYWLKRFETVPTLEIPTVKKRPTIKTYNGATLSHQFSTGLYANVQAYCKAQGVTTFMTLMAGINGVFYRYTNASDIVIGTTVAGREHPDVENQIGLFINSLPIRTTFNGAEGFKALINTQKETLVDAYKHQSYPFDELVAQLDMQMELSRSALFDVMVILQNQKSVISNTVEMAGDIALTPYKKEKKYSQFDITFSFIETNENLQLNIDYNTDIYTSAFIQNLIQHLDQFIKNGIADDKVPLYAIDYLTFDEKQELTKGFNTTSTAYDQTQTLVSLFQNMVKNESGGIALVAGDVRYTYQEVDEISDRLATFLLAEYNVTTDDRIGIQLQRDEWLPISLLAILKTGTPYVPVDPNFPQDRKDYIIANSNCALMIDETVIEKFKNYKNKPTVQKPTVQPSDTCYVIYTSGSTGKPKGVMLSHQNVTSFLANAETNLGFGGSNRVAATTNVVFDISVLEIFGALCSGRTLVLFSYDELMSSELFLEKLKTEAIEVLQLTPSRFSLLADQISKRNFPTLKTILIGGEPFSKSVFENKNKYKGIKLLNVYGPTETTIWSTVSEIHEANSLHVGKPLANEEVFILSDHLQVQPKWLTGELCISGDGVAQGYLNRDELTAEKFIPHPYKENERLYKTGDVARWIDNGNIELLGRKDDQIKWNGYRIELGEIESAIRRFTSVENVVVLLNATGTQKQLTAYVVANTVVTASELRDFLRTILPQYMLPSHYVQLEKLPLNASGKIDRKALQKIQPQEAVEDTQYEAPRNELEQTLATIWETAFERDTIGIHHNFFDLGGHSLLAIKIISEIQKQLNIQVELTDLLLEPTIEKLAESIEDKSWQRQAVQEELVSDRMTI